MDLLAYFRILRRRWTLIVLCVAVGAVLGVASTFLNGGAESSSGHYKAVHTLVLETSQTDDGESSATFTNLDQIAVLVTAGEVPELVGDELGGNGRRLTERITTVTSSTTSTLDVVAIGTDPREAERLADAFATLLIANLDQREQERFDETSQQTIARLDRLTAEIAALDAQLAANPGDQVVTAQRNGFVDQYRLAFERFQQLAGEGAPTSGLVTLETATAIPVTEGTYRTLLERAQRGENNVRLDALAQDEEDPTRTVADSESFGGPVARGVLGGFLGLLLGVGLALMIDRFDRRLRSREEVEEAFGLPVLAEVPVLTSVQQRRNEVVTHTSPMSRAAEAYRAIRTSLLFQSLRVDPDLDGASGNGEGREPGGAESRESLVIMVTSPAPQDGKTTTSVNLAAAFAETGSSVVVVNCDFRRPMAHQFLGVADEPRRTLETAIPRVWLVSGVVSNPSAHPAQVIASQRQVIAAAREHFDVVVLDTAPLLTANDAVEIASTADLVVLVAKAHSTTSDAAIRSTEMLRRMDAPFSGVVMVATRAASDDYYYYYQRGATRDVARSSRRRQRAESSAQADAGQTRIFAERTDEPEPSS